MNITQPKVPWLTGYHRYYKNGSDELLKEMAPAILEAVEYVVRKTDEYWTLPVGSRPENGIDLSEMPGQEFGFQPVETKLVYFEADSARSPTGTVSAIDVYAGTTEMVKAKRPMNKVEAFSHFPSHRDPVFYRAQTSKAENGSLRPILFNLELGLVVNVTTGLYKKLKNGLAPAKRCGGAICVYNWVEGTKTYIAQFATEVTVYGTNYSDIRYWTLPFLEIRSAKLEQQEAYKTAMKEDPKNIPAGITQTEYAEQMSQMAYDDFWKTRQYLNLFVGGAESAWDLAKNAWFRHKSGYGPMRLDAIGMEGASDLTSYVEHLYALPANTLQPILKGPNGNMETLFGILRYFGPLFQNVLQTVQTTPWFLPNVMSTLSPGGAPLNSNEPSLQKLFGLTKPVYREMFMNRTQEEFVFFMHMVRHKPTTSVKEFDAAFSAAKSAEKKLDSLEGPGAHYTGGKTVFRGKYGRMLFSSCNVPHAMEFYSKHYIFKSCSVTRFYHYIEEEIGNFPKLKNNSRVSRLYNHLADYNRMLRQVVPSTKKFVLPHGLPAAHNHMVDNFNRIAKDKETSASEEERFAKCYEGKDPDVYTDGKFRMVYPKAINDLYIEGITLNHCVGSYGTEIIKGRSSMLIFFCRKHSQPDKPLITVQVNKQPDGKYTLTEVAGKGNRLPTEDEQNFVSAWIEKFNEALEERKKEAEEAKRIAKLYPAFNDNIKAWAATAAGVKLDDLPPYVDTITRMENYEALFEFVATKVARAGAKLTDEEKADFKEKARLLCGQYHLPKTVADIACDIIEKAA